MTGKERLDAALNFTEADRVPYDLGGTSVSSIAKTAFHHAMQHRGHTGLGYVSHDIDPIQQIVFPDSETTKALGIDTQRFGLPRLFGEATGPVEVNGIRKLTDQFGCDWQFDPSQDFYYNQSSSPSRISKPSTRGSRATPFPPWPAGHRQSTRHWMPSCPTHRHPKAWC